MQRIAWGSAIIQAVTTVSFLAASVFVRPEILEAEFSKEKDKAKGLEKSVKRKLREHKASI